MKKTRLVSLALSAAMMISVAGCGSTGGDSTSTTAATTKGAAAATTAAATDAATDAAPAAGGESVTLKVWGAQEEQALLREMCASFEAQHPETTYTFEYGVVGEPDAKARYSEDPAAAADVFMFSNDQLRDLVNASGLYEVTRDKDDIVSRNVPGSVESATLNDTLYAYPMTADNGYFLYYDKSVFSEEDVKSLDKMLEVANTAGKKVFMDVSNGWYIASFFLGAGGKLWIENDAQKCDFNNANGVAAGEAIKAFTADNAFITGDDSILQGGMGTSIAAGVSGTWNAAAMQEVLGDNYAATKLPTFTCGGKQVQMASFGGYKLVGVNSLTANPTHAMDLANWLTSEENQIRRFEVREIGPSNIAASESPEVKANLALAALAEQSAFALPQNDVLGSYWTPAEAFGVTMEAKDYSVDMQSLLDNLVSQIEIG